MCTLIVLHRCVAGAPLVVGANRDEFFERPAETISLRGTPHGPIAAPRDKRAGGTWLGLSANGLFAAVTNRRSEAPDPSRRSRGLLVLEALGERTASDAAKRFERLTRDVYNPFNLLVADCATAHVVSYDGRSERLDLAPGAHVIGNVHPSERTPKIERLRAETARAAAVAPSAVLDELAAICRGHAGDDALQSTCVHAGEYGTRSSMLLRLEDEGGQHEMRYADGAPCGADYHDSTPLLSDLGFKALGVEGQSKRGMPR